MDQKKTIDFQILARIINRLDWIYDEEFDYPDGRKIHNWERAIENRFKKLGADEQMKKDIYETYSRFHPTYKEQCDKLRARGYIIVNNGKKEAFK